MADFFAEHFAVFVLHGYLSMFPEDRTLLKSESKGTSLSEFVQWRSCDDGRKDGAP
jgi:hypothetical protein